MAGIKHRFSIARGNCLEKMKKLRDNSVSLILCDLPYGVTKCKWDEIIPFEPLWEEYKRVLKKPYGVIVLFAQQPFTTKVIASNMDWYKYNLIWVKNNTTKHLLAHSRPMTRTEDICIFSPGGMSSASHRNNTHMTYNPQNLKRVDKVCKNRTSAKGLGMMLSASIKDGHKLTNGSEYVQKFTNYPDEFLHFPNDRNAVHPTQKPIALLEHLIRTYSMKREIVLDNTMGSGSTGVACMRTNRQFAGVEQDPEFYEIAKRRIFEAANPRTPMRIRTN